MKLLTKTIEKSLPALYATEKTPKTEKKVRVKFFSIANDWTWYGVEYDPIERRFFGLVKGYETEWGYFSLDELETVRHPIFKALPAVERDMYFKPITVAELEEKLARGEHV